MIIAKPCVVSLTWTLTDASNQPLDELQEPTEFFFGGQDLLPRVEEALDGQEPGFETRIQLEPEHAFGAYDASLVCFEDRSLFPEALIEGMRFEGLPPGSKTPGMPVQAIYTVTEIYPTHVVLDGNHPLAGMALRLQMKVVDVREANEAEVQLGSVGDAMVALVDLPPATGTLH